MITETTKILSEEDVLKFLEQDSVKSIGHKLVWERVLEHVKNGEIITFDYKTEELHWFNDLVHT
ncbi:MAG: hypothetical protein Q8O28_11360 [Smithellaceae bacterium]|nr:hypothetical protein [Smithellaceae bacterium]